LFNIEAVFKHFNRFCRHQPVSGRIRMKTVIQKVFPNDGQIDRRSSSQAAVRLSPWHTRVFICTSSKKTGGCPENANPPLFNNQ
jgi:hypothetical protein